MPLEQPSWTAPFRAESRDRAAFVRNVYLWLMAGFTIAGLGAFTAPFIASALLPSLGRFFPWALFIAQFGSLLWAQAVSRRRPMNRFAFGVFTYVSGVIAGILAMVVARQSGMGVVLAAFGMTGGAFLGLSATAWITRKDFSFLRSFIVVGIAIMFFGSLIAAVFHLPMLSLVASAVAVVACSAKLLYDTSAMLRTDDQTDPAAFALSLFVSLYNIFIALMNLLGNRRS